jgi:hypothetical protein
MSQLELSSVDTKYTMGCLAASVLSQNTNFFLLKSKWPSLVVVVAVGGEVVSELVEVRYCPRSMEGWELLVLTGELRTLRRV